MFEMFECFTLGCYGFFCLVFKLILHHKTSSKDYYLLLLLVYHVPVKNQLYAAIHINNLCTSVMCTLVSIYSSPSKNNSNISPLEP